MRRRNKIFIFLIIFIILFPVIFAGSVKVIVTDENGKRIEGAVIYTSYPLKEDYLIAGTTNSSGECIVYLCSGFWNYDIRASKPGYYDDSKHVCVETGKMKTIYLTLDEIPLSPTPAPTTLPLPTTTTPPQQSNLFFYIGIFVGVLALIFMIYKIITKKPKEIKEKIAKEVPEKEKLSPERMEQIKRELGDNKLYLKNLTIMYERGEVREEIYDRMKKRYKDKIKELERRLNK